MARLTHKPAHNFVTPFSWLLLALIFWWKRSTFVLLQSPIKHHRIQKFINEWQSKHKERKLFFPTSAWIHAHRSFLQLKLLAGVNKSPIVAGYITIIRNYFLCWMFRNLWKRVLAIRGCMKDTSRQATRNYGRPYHRRVLTIRESRRFVTKSAICAAMLDYCLKSRHAMQ